MGFGHQKSRLKRDIGAGLISILATIAFLKRLLSRYSLWFLDSTPFPVKNPQSCFENNFQQAVVFERGS